MLVSIALAGPVEDAQCLTGCRWAGYDQGSYNGTQCACVDLKDFDYMARIDEKRLKVGVRRTPAMLKSFPPAQAPATSSE